MSTFSYLEAGTFITVTASKDGYYCGYAESQVTSGAVLALMCDTTNTKFYSVDSSGTGTWTRAKTEWIYFKKGQQFNVYVAGTAVHEVRYAPPIS